MTISPVFDDTSSSREEPSRENLRMREQLSSANAVLTLSLVLTQAGSAHQVMRLAATAVPTIAACEAVRVWSPQRAGNYFEHAPREVRRELGQLPPHGGPIQVGHYPWSWAYPLGASAARPDRTYLVVSGQRPLADEETFLISVLAQLSGTVVSKLESIDAERAGAEALAEVNDKLAATVASLSQLMETHRRLNAVAASDRGEQGIADELHRLTGRPILIQDSHGNLRVTAGPVLDSDRVKEPPAARQDLLRRLLEERRPLYRKGSWLLLASPRTDIRGVILLRDADKSASENDLSALEYSGTVLSMELARLQSIAEAELRSHRDFAEELLAGASAEAVKTTGHALRYDVQRPHRVIMVSSTTGERLPEGFFDTVAQLLRKRGIGTLIVGRSDAVIGIASQDADWCKLQTELSERLRAGGCRLAIGSRYPNAWDIEPSYREAQFVTKLAVSLGGHHASTVLEFDSLGIYKLLSAVTDLQGVERFMQSQLSALVEYDQAHNTNLVLTLAKYFDHSCNHDLTADALCIHKGTVKYRLKRIRELTGRDLADGPSRLELHLATTIWMTLQSLHRTDSA